MNGFDPRFHVTYENGRDFSADKGGVPWYKAPAPRRWHRHSAHTIGSFDGFYVERCVCGAFGPEPWWMLGPDVPRRRKFWRVPTTCRLRSGRQPKDFGVGSSGLIGLSPTKGEQ